MKCANLHIGILLLFSILLLPTYMVAQDIESIGASEQYLEERIDALQKIRIKQSAYYKKLLRKLESDSMANPRDTVATHQQDKKLQKSIDSLKGIYRFLTDQKAKLGSLPSNGVSDQPNEKLNALETQIGEQTNLQHRIDQALAKMAASGNTRQLEKLKKKYDIVKAKSEFWKEKLSEPDDAEEMALEYLRGVEGFDSYLQQTSNKDNIMSNSSHTNASIEELERMGFQTKRMVKAEMQAQLGDGFDELEQKMADDLSQAIEPLNKVRSKLDKSKEQLATFRQQAESAKGQVSDGINGLKSIDKPSFSNPMRGVPFRYRLETLCNIQTSRPGADNRPAMITGSFTVLYKQTLSLSYGIGVSGSLGLGKDWRNIRFSNEGIGANVLIDLKWAYGISAQAGYEHRFGARPAFSDTLSGNEASIKDFFKNTDEMLYIGIMKRYRINDRWQGTLFAGYDFLRRDRSAQSPFVFRLGFSK